MSTYMYIGFINLESLVSSDAVIENDLFAIEITPKWENVPLPKRQDGSAVKPTETIITLESSFESMINGGDRSRHRSFRPSKTINAKISRPSFGELACPTQVGDPVNHK